MDEDTSSGAPQGVDQDDGEQADRPASDETDDSQGHLMIRIAEAVTPSKKVEGTRRPS